MNGIYIGNLGGHFEAWFLTLDELIKFNNHDLLFLLLLPMAGIEKEQTKMAKEFVSKQLRLIPGFKEGSNYIAECIVNGLVMNGGFQKAKIGITNNQNHSVRNIEKYPRYKDDVMQLNAALKTF